MSPKPLVKSLCESEEETALAGVAPGTLFLTSEVNMKDLTNKQVIVRPRHYKWILNHLDCYEADADEYISNMDIDIQIGLMGLMGVPIQGVVKAEGNCNCWQVLIFVGGLSDITYIDEKDLILG